jgi:hypothetical protein
MSARIAAVARAAACAAVVFAAGPRAFPAQLSVALSRGVASDDTTAETLKELKAAYKAKDGTTAVRLFDQLTSAFAGLPPKDQEEVVKVIESAFGTRHDDGKDVDMLFVGASASLAQMGPSGGKALLRSLALKHVQARPAVVAALVEGLGEQNDPAMVPELLKWLKPEKPLGIHAEVVAGAARALAHYREADAKVRKQAVGEMIAVYVDLDARTRAERAKERANPDVETAFQQIETPVLLTLRTLSGENYERAEDWAKWWTKAKDADWSGDAPAPAPVPPKKSGIAEPPRKDQGRP